MKTLPNSISAAFRFFVGMRAFVLLIPAASAADVEPEPKTHVLFQGASVTLEQSGKLCPVVDVAGDAFVIWSNGQEVTVSGKGAAKMKVATVMKLTENSAELQAFRAERAYTPANDPEVAYQRSLRQAARLAAEGIALSNQESAPFKSGAGSVSAGGSGGTAAIVASQSSGVSLAQQQATMELQRVSGAPGSSMLLNRGAGEVGAGYDAIRVGFEVTAPRMLGRPFVVMTARYRAPDTAPGKTANWVYARALKPIGSKPLKVEVEQGGFPPGFEFEDLQVHLYDNGQEVATNLAAKRTAMTLAEAHAYVVKNYVSRQPAATLPARPAMGRRPADYASRRQAGQLPEVVYVKVSREGRPLESFLDEACTRPVEPAVADIVGGVLFFPALEAGQPTEGVAPVDFAKLAW